jgi:hypothetical protein
MSLRGWFCTCDLAKAVGEGDLNLLCNTLEVEMQLLTSDSEHESYKLLKRISHPMGGKEVGRSRQDLDCCWRHSLSLRDKVV